MSERISEDMSKDMSERMSEDISEGMSERMSKDMSERTSEDCFQSVCEVESNRTHFRRCPLSLVIELYSLGKRTFNKSLAKVLLRSFWAFDEKSKSKKLFGF